jgi:hypothetical protein
MRKLIAVLVALLAFAGLTIWSQAQRLQDLRAKISATGEALKSSQEEAEKWRKSSREYGRDLHRLRRNVENSVGSLDAPHFSVWNACGSDPGTSGCPIGPGSFYAGGVPDTFTFYPHFRATVPVKVMFMSLDDFVCFRTQQCRYHFRYWGPTKRLGPPPDDPDNPYDSILDFNGPVWHLSEGCADYIVVYMAEQHGTLFPNESVTYNPARQPTGVCR